MLAQSLCLQLAFIRSLATHKSVSALLETLDRERKKKTATEKESLQLAGKNWAMERLWANSSLSARNEVGWFLLFLYIAGDVSTY